MLLSIGWKGQFMIELLLDDSGNFWFIELNGRPWGSMALALRMGFPYPLWTAQQVLNPNFIPTAPVTHQPVTCRHMGREIIHVLQVIRGPSSPAIPNWPSVRQTLLNVLRIKKMIVSTIGALITSHYSFTTFIIPYSPKLFWNGWKIAVKAMSHIHSDWSYDGAWSLADIARFFYKIGCRVVLCLNMTQHSAMTNGNNIKKPAGNSAVKKFFFSPA